MDVTLTPELEQYVNEKVQSGMYPSVSEVVREGLMLLRKRDETDRIKLEKLRQAIQIGIDELDRGEGVPLTDELMEEIKAEGRKRLAEGLGRISG
jgi:antitoxin ParD1/3/4